MSVAIASFNSAPFIGAALRSALRQTLTDLEVIVVDDASTDATVCAVASEAAGDARVQVHVLTENTGPGAARNFAISHARGEWLAVLDADDLMAPDRLRQLVEIGQQQAADIVADDLIVFGNGTPTERFLGPAERGGRLPLDEYLRRTVIYGGGANLGYLKPLIRRDALRRSGVQYDPALRIAEDDDFVARMLAAGLHYWIDPVPRYGYRRHLASTSHRLSVDNAAAMLRGGQKLAADLSTALPQVRQALAKRNQGLGKALAFAGLIDALKQSDPLQFARIGIANPAALGLLRMPVLAQLRRWFPRAEAQDDPAAVRALAEIMQC